MNKIEVNVEYMDHALTIRDFYNNDIMTDFEQLMRIADYLEYLVKLNKESTDA